jgi:hypothetical protein
MSFPTLYLGPDIRVDENTGEIKVETNLNVPSPMENTDIANKKYVDDKITTIFKNLGLFKTAMDISKQYVVPLGATGDIATTSCTNEVVEEEEEKNPFPNK